MKRVRFYVVPLCFVAVITTLSCTGRKDVWVTEFGKDRFSVRPIKKTDIKLIIADPSELQTDIPEGVIAEKFFIEYSKDKVITGMLFSPESPNDRALLFLHCLGGTNGIDKGTVEFHEEAADFAAKGYLCAVPEGYFPWMAAPMGIEEDEAAIKRQISEYRITLNLLSGILKTDDPVIGVIGHDYGAMHSLILMKSDIRIDFACVLTPTTDYWSWNTIISSFKSGGEFEQNYRKVFHLYEPINLIAETERPVFMQFGKKDDYVSYDKRERFLDSKSDSVIVKTYDFGHQLNRLDEATDDRRNWILSM